MLQSVRYNVTFATVPALPIRCGHVCVNGSRDGKHCHYACAAVPVEQARSPSGVCGPEAKFMEFKQ